MVNELGTKGAIFDFDSFLADLERKEFEIEVFDKRKIKERCKVSLLHGIRRALLQTSHRKYRIAFEKDNQEIVWPSDSRPGWIVVNLAHLISPSDLVGMVAKAVKRGKQVERDLDETEEE